MKFVYRFAYYFIGLIFGLIFVSVLFSKKNTRCNYFPNARVLNELRNKPLTYSDKVQRVLRTAWIDTTDIKNTLQYGDINFDQSNIAVGTGKIYVISGKTTENKYFILKVINYTDKAVLDDIIKVPTN